MIALLLAAQLSGQTLVQPRIQKAAPPPPGLIRNLPRKSACLGETAHLEVSFAQPAALYRKGDRPAVDLRNWVAYPEAQVCLVAETAP